MEEPPFYISTAFNGPTHRLRGRVKRNECSEFGDHLWKIAFRPIYVPRRMDIWLQANAPSASYDGKYRATCLVTPGPQDQKSSYFSSSEREGDGTMGKFEFDGAFGYAEYTVAVDVTRLLLFPWEHQQHHAQDVHLSHTFARLLAHAEQSPEETHSNKVSFLCQSFTGTQHVIPASKTLLMTVSGYFRSMFDPANDFDESSVEGVEPTALPAACTFELEEGFISDQGDDEDCHVLGVDEKGTSTSHNIDGESTSDLVKQPGPNSRTSKQIIVRYATSEVFDAVMTWVRSGSICFVPSRRQYERYCKLQEFYGISDVAPWAVWKRENAQGAGALNITQGLPLVTAKATYRLADRLDMPLLRNLAESKILEDLSPEDVWHTLASDFAKQYNFVQPSLVELAKAHWNTLRHDHVGMANALKHADRDTLCQVFSSIVR